MLSGRVACVHSAGVVLGVSRPQRGQREGCRPPKAEGEAARTGEASIHHLELMFRLSL